MWANISSRIVRSTLWETTAMIRACTNTATTASTYRAAIRRIAPISWLKSGEAEASSGVI